VKAKNLLEKTGNKYIEYIYPGDFNKEDLKTIFGENAVTVPQIIDPNGIIIGGYDDLVVHLDDVAGGFGDNFDGKYAY